ncbi:MAG: hypothetical protein DWQ35_18245 [Planctomycetota bacterium]|nr:MAG: hypothetical protein DWQ35_18245 [Planctomycetota bacterium]REK44552.1 MAG: hypothetical protein DWQ46_09865 [Planctomycetota bacterium]
MATWAALVVVCGCVDTMHTHETLTSKPSAQIARLLELSLRKARLGCSPAIEAFESDFDTSDVCFAKAHVQNHQDYTSYHLLFLLREQYPNIYGEIPEGTRARILCSALENTIVTNDWGLLDPEGSRDHRAGKALLELGDSALAHLEPLLDNKDGALIAGNESATTAWELRIRRADYAYRYMIKLLGREPVFVESLGERDRLIEKLKAEYTMTW